MATTMGVKIDKRMRQRLIVAAQSLGKTPHWLMKHAIIEWLERVEGGADLTDLTGEALDEIGDVTLSSQSVID
jgi:RHH-type proline utilization regulon transcriptional repressor/proline dehydrogenase/delta 1-pyrroline-5-carboxylate dehydrogenase